jgi:hypothetical protein
MRVGLSISIDVTKIDKARLYRGKKGLYLNMTTFFDSKEEDKYGHHGFVSQSVSPEEREQGVEGEILGNVRVIYAAGGDNKPVKKENKDDDSFTYEEIPF